MVEGEVGVLAINIDTYFCSVGSEKEGEETGLGSLVLSEGGVFSEGRGRKSSREVRGGTWGECKESGEEWGSEGEGFDKAGRGTRVLSRGVEAEGALDTRGEFIKQ